MSTIQKVSVVLAAGVWVSAVAVAQPQGADAAAVAEAFGGGLAASEYRRGGFPTPQQQLRLRDRLVHRTGYLSYTDENFLGVFVAPLELPGGARDLFAICAYFYDTAPVGNVTPLPGRRQAGERIR